MGGLSEIAETVVDPAAYANWDRIDPAFSWLRRHASLVQLQPDGFDRFWAVTRHADILEIERQSETFRSGERPITLVGRKAEMRIRESTGGSPHFMRTLVHMDSPDHLAYRRVTQAAFMPKMLRDLEHRIRGIARGFIDEMADRGGACDFAADIALPYPLRVIMELLGVPRADEPFMLKMTQEVLGNADPDMNRSGQVVDPVKSALDRQHAFTDLMTYFEAMTTDRRACPRDDLATVIAHGEVKGCPLGHMETLSYYSIVATAGHDTTSNTISGALWALAERPGQWHRLKQDLGLIPSHVEESIRWETSVKHFMRSAARDVDFHGQQIRKGDWLMLCYASGNRDETVFDTPYDYCVDRAPNNHLAFGYGPHLCLGQHLARMEMRILWEELLPRIATVELDGIARRSKANFVCGPKELPIRYVMR